MKIFIILIIYETKYISFYTVCTQIKVGNGLKEKYFPKYDDGNHRGKWILTGPKEENHLIKMGWTRIRWHEMITLNNSPIWQK